MAVFIDERICKGCGICVHHCKQDVLAISNRRNAKGYNVAEVVNGEACSLCLACEINCPDLAVYVERGKKAGGQKGS